MARIKGVDIPKDKRIEISLTYIYGIGRNLSKTILNNAKVDLNKKAKDLTDDELSRIRAEVEKYTVERGNVGCGGSGGSLGVFGSKKSTPFAAGMAAEAAGREATAAGMKTVNVKVKGLGSGREAAIRSLQTVGLEVKSITDETPIPHNGCRPPKRRRG